VECIGVKNNDGKDVQTNVKEQEVIERFNCKSVFFPLMSRFLVCMDGF